MEGMFMEDGAVTERTVMKGMFMEDGRVAEREQ